jgi:hypothetical protein
MCIDVNIGMAMDMDMNMNRNHFISLKPGFDQIKGFVAS